MRVLLIAPTANYKHHYPSPVAHCLFPTGFAYLASALRNAGHEVFGLNPNNVFGYQSAHAMISDKISGIIKDTNPDLIGIGGLCTDYAFIKDAIKIIRDASSDTPIVLGGGIVSNDMEFIFNQLRPDFCIAWEGEEVLVKLANAIESKNCDYSNIPNMGYWENGISKFTKIDFNYGDINLRSFPDYEPFISSLAMNDYVMTSSWWYRYTRPDPKPFVMITARSCPFSCTFCVHHGGPKYRARSIDNIMQEIKLSYDKYHFNILILMDELFAVNKTRMTEFCNALISNKESYGWDFDWIFTTHASASLDRDTLILAKNSGCVYFGYGLESASPRVIQSMNKKIDPSQIVNAINIADDVGIGYGGNLIFGDPAETQDTVMESIDFMLKHCMDVNILLAAIRPYPGSKIFETCLSRGLIKSKSEFYEHIDENPWNMTVNMTDVPDKIWLPFLDSIVAFGQLFPWVKTVSPYRYELDDDAIGSPVVINSGRQIYKIWARCPHCDADIYYRELLALRKGGIPDAAVVKKSNHFIDDVNARIKLMRDAVGKAMRLINLYYLSFRHPVYKLLKSSVRNNNRDLFWDSFFATVFFVTGCTHCHKRIKIVIPIPFTIKSFSFTEIKRRFNLV